MAREDDLQARLKRLLRERYTGNREADLVEAGREVWERRQTNTDDGKAVIDALREEFDYSLGKIQRKTGIPKNTAWRWGTPPGDADTEAP